ncbi:hypothetical protein EV138_2514 [Kribbella voronezhensis]|uniref:Uncharacterized protein n=1 Tax=Kribbella voronezhensis TaxID=2512212 RepID=A0A4R7TAD7_9ACTN|nr:hypothetical protein [Kribbella voronezhensis]TDU88961.1 hypothetical protein EV138_2514 [Kribbella voronezhensis]
MSAARRSRHGWLRTNTVALLSLVAAIPLSGWVFAHSDYESWRNSEPRDPIVVAAGGTAYMGATWYAATTEVDPEQSDQRDTPAELPAGTVRVRVYFRLRVDDLSNLEKGLGGCQIHLRAPDGRTWDESILEDAFQDRPTGCTGGYDDKVQSFRPPAIAQYYVKPKAGKPFETVAVFVVPKEVAATVQPTITWATSLPHYLAFPR